MTTRKEALIALRDKVRDGEHWHFDETPVPDGFPECWIDAYNGSLDAALALHEAVLPWWGFEICEYSASVSNRQTDDWLAHCKCFDANNNNPARALLLAILEALIAEEE